jgi:hypothetical protein
MKNFKSFMLTIVGMFAIIVCASMFTACSQDEYLPEVNQTEKSQADDQAIPETRALMTSYYGIQVVGTQPYEESTHGKPDTTYFKFFATDQPTTVTKIRVVFHAPDGATYGLDDEFLMSKKSGTNNWFLEKKLIQTGRYTVEYHIFTSGSSSYQTAIPYPNYVDISYVTAHIVSNQDNCWIKIYWPFDDGSSPSNNVTYRNNIAYKWLNGEADGSGGGYGWNEGSHIDGWYNSVYLHEKYALDYNLYKLDGTSAPNADNGTPLVSPVDGTVVASKYSSTYGNYVILRQYLGSNEIRVYLGHLGSRSVSYGDRVIAGETSIGTVGSTGASSPHLHMNVWKYPNESNKTSIKHYLDPVTQ